MKRSLMVIFLVVMIGFLYWYYSAKTVVGSNIPPNKIINFTTVNEFKNKSPKALSEIEIITLDNLGLSSWKNSSNLSPLVAFGDVINGPEEELIVALSLGKDTGVLAVYHKTTNGYELVTSLKNLAPISGLAFVKLPGMTSQALIIDEFLNEMFGAFYKVKTKAIYGWENNGFKKLWEREIMREEYYPEDFKMAGDKTQWLRKTEVAKVTFTEEGNISVVGEIEFAKNKALGELNGDYQLTSTEKIKEYYIWNAKTRLFKRQLLLNF